MNGLRCTWFVLMCVAILYQATATTLSFAEDEKPLIDVITSDAPRGEKTIACKKLALCGSGKCVPALAALLQDEELAAWARIALEVIPDPSVDEALRASLERLDGRQRIGVIRSIGVRQDAAAVGALTKLLGSDDVELVTAAAETLGRIGGDKAIEALVLALEADFEPVRSEVAYACILCAEKLMAHDKAILAAELYDIVLAAKVPECRVAQATRGAILSRGAEGVPLLLNQLKSGDRAMVQAALAAARELTASSVSQELLSGLADLDADLRALVILALADRGDAETLPAMLSAAQEGPVAVRLSAIEVLGILGDETCVPLLLTLASDDYDDIRETARGALSILSGDGVNVLLTESLAEAEGKRRLALIELVGRRRIEVIEPLLKAVNDSGTEVRAAALKALGEVASLENLSVLIDTVLEPVHAEDGQVAAKALRAASVRMADREACAERLAKALEDAPTDARVTIMETLGEVGGTKALAAIGRMGKSEDEEMQDAATRVLGEWMSIDAGPVLLDLATDPNSSYRVRALRGYLRLPRQFGPEMSDEQRVAMCREGWNATQRDAERELVLEVIGRYPSKAMLQLAQDLAVGEALADEAAVVAKVIEMRLKDGGAQDK
ncbi:HEAT repeat domain-containing protein [Novipirellula artificiosorum]|uniref:Putative lyase n=1 Tax=Novipirellula artificiosorum TaxID=2528016 RepID=A0A5C6DE84_9BACT|nr:HEAT repeat domain-containing protein [Novipirellula artificiosorum]TWU33229.1 putative lyase [Novipirellula artificiosorum]